MTTTALHDRLAAAGARMGSYRGAVTAAAFGDVAAEFAALRNKCALFDLGWHSNIIVTGPDRVRWMNGMITNNVRDLAVGRGVYSFLLTPQGRIVADLYCYNRGEYLLVNTDADQTARLRETFDKFVIMDDVELTDASDKLTSIGIGGAQAARVLAETGIYGGELKPLEVQDVIWNDIGLSIVRSDDELTPIYELWLAPAKAEIVWDALAAAGAQP